MWHEARKQEKKIRGILVNHKKRAERRRDFYEKMKADPTQFLQLHGRPTKIHLDPAVALAADSPANMMPWQGRPDILIDRFDVRAHLDYISEHPDKPDVPKNEDLSYEDRMGNYERYRIIVQNEFLGIEEDKFLHQLNLEEKFGPTVEVEKKPSKVGKGAAIPYSYEDSTPVPENADVTGNENADEEEDEDDSDIDFDLCVDVSQVNAQQAAEMNVCGSSYGMTGNDFFSFLTRDIEEKESMRMAREQEEEKAMFSGRKSRRERRAFREKRLVGRKISPPSYAARCSPTYDPYRKSESKSPSRSRSPPVPSGQITYITSFGDEEEEPAPPPPPSLNASSSSFRRLPNADERLKRQAVRDRLLGKADRPRSPATRRPGKPRSRSPAETFKYRRNRSRSKSPQAETSRYRRGNKSRSPDGYRRKRSPSRSPARYRASPPSRSPARHRSSPSHRRSNKSRSRSPSPRYRRGRRRSRSSSRSDPGRTRSPTPPPVRRYYGSRRGKSSSLELESSSDADSKPQASSKLPNKNSSAELGNSGAGSKYQQQGNARERLKKKMQSLLNRQYKADKKAERLRVQKQQDERQEREDELREMAIKLRRRERERRHRDRGDSEDETGSWRSSSSSSSDRSPSSETRRTEQSSSSRAPDEGRSRRDRRSPSPDSKKQRLVDY